MRRGLIIVMRTDRIIKHIQTAKTSEISYLQDLMYCFCNSKNIVVISVMLINVPIILIMFIIL